jgi:hypothetical protein
VPVSINGCWPVTVSTPNDRLLFPCGSLTHHVKEHVGHDYQFPVGLVRDGWNEITVENGGDEPLTVLCIELGIMTAEKSAV